LVERQILDRGVSLGLLGHELTHALLDQHFPSRFVERSDPAFESEDTREALMSLNEGVASLVGGAINRGAGEKDDLDLEQLLPMLHSLSDSSRVPRIEMPMLSYVAGMAFVKAGAKQLECSWQQAARRALDDPPVSMRQMLRPWEYWDPQRRHVPRKITWPRLQVKLPEQWVVREQNALGPISLPCATPSIADVLAAEKERIERPGPPPTPDELKKMGELTYEYELGSDAVGGWDGDRYTIFGSGESEILILASVWEDEAAAKSVELAWKASQPVHLSKGRRERTVVGVWMRGPAHGIDTDAILKDVFDGLRIE
jgi:hypothetical protein